MKNLALAIFVLVFSQSAFSGELTEEALQGDWLIVALSGGPESDKDYWQFEGDKFYQNLDGHRISPDTFTVKPGIIDLGYAKIKVLEFDGKEMTADMAGFKYTLKKE